MKPRAEWDRNPKFLRLLSLPLVFLPHNIWWEYSLRLRKGPYERRDMRKEGLKHYAKTKHHSAHVTISACQTANPSLQKSTPLGFSEQGFIRVWALHNAFKCSCIRYDRIRADSATLLFCTQCCSLARCCQTCRIAVCGWGPGIWQKTEDRRQTEEQLANTNR